MSRGHHIDRALRRAQSRDRKRRPQMKVSGTSVFILKRMLRTKRAK